MSAADPQTPEVNTGAASLSPEARALLRELEGGASLSAKNASIAEAFYAQPEEMADAAAVLGAPIDDPKAAAFAELLEHLGDADEALSGDDAAAMRAAERFRAERARSGMRLQDAASDLDDGMDGGMDGAPDDEMSGPDTGTDTGAGMMADDAVLLEEEYGDVDVDADADADFDFDFELDEKPRGLKALFGRLAGGGGRAVKRLVGVKDAGSAYEAQSGATLLPYTIIRAVILVLVAAVPPIVNLSIIQPQISDNNRKITETLSFEAKSKEDEKIADKLANTIANVERRSQSLMGNLMPEAELQPLVNNYVAALQRYGVDLNSYNVTSDASRKVIVGDLVQDTMVVELDLVTRYDVYSEIRKIFVGQADKISVIDETFKAQPGSVDLQVTSRVMIPVRRGFDAELDKPAEGEK